MKPDPYLVTVTSVKKKRSGFLTCFRCNLDDEKLPAIATNDKSLAEFERHGDGEVSDGGGSFFSAFEHLHQDGQHTMGTGMPFDATGILRPSWSYVDAKSFNVRIGPDYKNLGLKAPSLPALYKPVGFDVFSGFQSDISGRVQFPQMKDSLESVLPVFMIVVVQLPLELPLIGRYDEGVSFAAYFELQDGLDPNIPAVSLFNRLLERGITDKSLCLKLIAKIDDWDAQNIPLSATLKKYNGKPGILTASTTIIQGKSPCSFVEIDIDLRKWNLLARSAFPKLKERTKDLTINLAILTEAQSDIDMPERVLGCITLNGLDTNKSHNIANSS
jgi:Protein ENHANCED DISEASE RESISTANCE 2, C-terminal